MVSGFEAFRSAFRYWPSPSWLFAIKSMTQEAVEVEPNAKRTFLDGQKGYTYLSSAENTL